MLLGDAEAPGAFSAAENSVTLCDLGILVHQPAEAVPAQNAHTGHFGRRMPRPGVRVLIQDPCGRWALQWSA